MGQNVVDTDDHFTYRHRLYKGDEAPNRPEGVREFRFQVAKHEFFRYQENFDLKFSCGLGQKPGTWNL